MAYLWAIDCAAGPEEGTMFTCTMIAPGIAYGPAVIWVTAGEFFRRQQISPPSVPAGRFASLGNGCLAARAEDFAELGDRLLRHLRKEAPRQAPCLSNPGVLIANHLGAADIIALERRNLLALVMIDKWPPMLRLVVRASLPAPGSVGLVIAKSVSIRLPANNRGNGGS